SENSTGPSDISLVTALGNPFRNSRTMPIAEQICPGVPDFRRRLLKAYGGRCAISDCNCSEALEAAHIRGYGGEETNHVQNGLLLRSDLHSLMDLGKIGVDPHTMKVIVC